MGKQLGIINVRGAVGDMSYVRTEDGYFIRRKSSVTKERMAKDPNYESVRQNQSEFKRATAAGKLLRAAVNEQLGNGGDSKLHSRLLKVMMSIIKSDPDPSHGPGLRVMEGGELGFLDGFEFNRFTSLNSCLPVKCVPIIDRVSGQLVIQVPDFTPDTMQRADATHFQLVSAGCELDFANDQSKEVGAESALYPIGNDPVAAFTLDHALTANSSSALVLVLGIRFYRMINTRFYRIRSEECNALSVLKTDQP